MKTYHRIFFDLDGTLSDPGDGIIQSVSYALAKMGTPVTDAARLRKFIGPPLQESFREYFPGDHDAIHRAILHYREHYRKQGMAMNYPYPGIMELLAELRRLDRRLSLATSKLDSIAAGVLDLIGMRHYFDAVGGSDAEGTVMNKTHVIGNLLAGLGRAEKDEIVMVGDMDLDIIGARNNGIDSIGVTWGYGSREEIAREKPTHLVETMDQLRNLLLPGQVLNHRMPGPY
jgi:phosphoglycolate phosphatase